MHKDQIKDNTPSKRKCTISGYYSGLAVYLGTKKNAVNSVYGDKENYYKLRDLIKDNLDYLIEGTGATSAIIKKNLVFTY